MNSEYSEEKAIQYAPEGNASSMDIQEETVTPSETEGSEGSQADFEPSGEQKMVPLAALHEERSRRQALQKEREYLNTRLTLLEGVFRSQLHEKNANSPSEEGGKSNDPPDMKQARNLFGDMYHVALFPEFLAIREEISRLKHPDYDEVISGFSDHLRSNASLQQAVLNAEDPAEMAYKLAKHGSAIWETSDKQSAKRNLEKIEKNLNAPRTPSARGGEISLEGVSIERLLEMPHDDFSRVWNALTPAQRRRLCQGEK